MLRVYEDVRGGVSFLVIINKFREERGDRVVTLREREGRYRIKKGVISR